MEVCFFLTVTRGRAQPTPTECAITKNEAPSKGINNWPKVKLLNVCPNLLSVSNVFQGELKKTGLLETNWMPLKAKFFLKSLWNWIWLLHLTSLQTFEDCKWKTGCSCIVVKRSWLFHISKPRCSAKEHVLKYVI